MASYLLIEARDNFRTGGAGFCHDLARRLAGAAKRVTLFLVQNGVILCAGASDPRLTELPQAGIEPRGSCSCTDRRGGAQRRQARLGRLRLCVDERGAGNAVDGIRRGSPANFWKMGVASDNTLVIGTR